MAAGQRSSPMQELLLRLTTTSGEESRDRHGSLEFVGHGRESKSVLGDGRRGPASEAPVSEAGPASLFAHDRSMRGMRIFLDPGEEIDAGTRLDRDFLEPRRAQAADSARGGGV